MRRAAAYVLGSIVGTSVLVGAKLGNTPMGGDATGTGAVVVGGGPAPSTPAGTGPQASGAPGVTTQPARPGAPTSTRPGQPAPTGTSHPTSAPTTIKPGSPPTHTSNPTPTPTPSPTHSGYTNGTYTASAPVRNGNYGTLNMTVTISGGKITAISASETNPTESSCYHSKCPTLISEALSAQSANISSVSGATYTSLAFKTSLQAILNNA